MPRHPVPTKRVADVKMKDVNEESVTASNRMIISLDFGTVNSKAAYTTVDATTAVNQLKQNSFDLQVIGDIDFDNQPTMPTIMAYHQGEWSFGNRVNSLISASSLPASKKISLMKLGLAEAAYTKETNSRLDRQLKELPDVIGVKTRQDLVVIFLREFHQQVRAKISSAFGMKDIWKTHKVETLLTIPACWKLEMIGMMKAAAQVAGLENVKLISEPEAAAMYFMYSRQVAAGPLVPAGPLGRPLAASSEPFVLLDVGGGTAVRFPKHSLWPT